MKIFLALLFVLLRAGVAFGITEDGVHEPKTLRIVFGTNIASLNPMQQLDLISASVLSNIYDALFYRATISSNVEPMLVVSYEIIGNNTLRCHLRRDVRFHDGGRLDAKAVKASIDYQRDIERSKWAGHLTFIKDVRVKDRFTIDIVTEGAPDNLINVLRYGYNYVMPTSYCKRNNGNMAEQLPVGTGPYKFAEKTNDSIILKKNEDYWGQKPFFDIIEYKFVSDDKKRLELLSDGYVDIVAQINPHLSLQILKTSNVKILKSMSPRVVFMEFVEGIKPRFGHGLFHDVMFRRALNYAIDRTAISKYVLLGNGVPLTSLVSPLFPAYEASGGYRYDPKKAMALLQQSAYIAEPNVITILAPAGRYPMDRQVAMAVLSYIKAIGVNAKLELYSDWPEYQNVLHGNTDKQDFIALVGFGVIDFKTMLDFYFGREWERNRFNDAGLIEEIRKLDDISDARLRIMKEKEIASMISDKGYVIPLYGVVNVYGVRRGVNMEPRDDEIVDARVVRTWNNVEIR